MITSKVPYGNFFLTLYLLVPVIATAQNEIARERHSLRGIQQMAFTVNLETNASLDERDVIEVTSLQRMGEKTLREGGISIIPDKQVEQSDRVPFLYMHINTMDAGRGLVPFNVTLYFYQPVKLPPNRDILTTAATWESSTLGIVSYDRLNLISKAAENTIEEFISDYHQANRAN
jgi:hypothetical protein